MKKSGLKKFICVLAGVICALLLAEPAFFGTELYPAAQAAEGYEEVRLIATDDGTFMGKKEAVWLGLAGSALLTGKK